MKPTLIRSNMHASALSSRLQQLRSNGEFVDCKIRIETKNGAVKEIFAHRNVIASGCKIFNEAFQVNQDFIGW